jgi:hypothetical protein
LTSISASGATPFILTPGVSRQASTQAAPFSLRASQFAGDRTMSIVRNVDYRAPRPQAGYV